MGTPGPDGAGSLGGYSGTPPAKKLGVKEGHSLLLIAAPEGWTVPDLPSAVDVRRAGSTPRGGLSADVIIAFCSRAGRLRRSAPAIAARLPSKSSLWIAWPRRAGGHESDITENLIREVLLPTGVVDVKVAALDSDWSGLKFVWRRR